MSLSIHNFSRRWCANLINYTTDVIIVVYTQYLYYLLQQTLLWEFRHKFISLFVPYVVFEVCDNFLRARLIFILPEIQV